MGYVTKDTLHALRGCLGVIVEANYNRQMLKNGPYPPDLQARVDGKLGHLENQDCAELCSYQPKTIDRSLPKRRYGIVLWQTVILKSNFLFR
jgi:hypothetical protein